MIGRLLALVAFVWAAPAPAQQDVHIAYLAVADDPYYEAQPVYTGLSLKDHNRPIDGARLAIKNARAIGRALGFRILLDEYLLPPDEDAAAVAAQLAEQGAIAILLDLPAPVMDHVLAQAETVPTLFNIRHVADRYRGGECNAALLHTIPSRAMLTDALAQYLRYQRWTSVLVLRGSESDDDQEVSAVRTSASKFGLSVVGEHVFALSNDPRQRDLTNILLMTQQERYDVIWLVDAAGEFGRYVPYATAEPRPVVGSEGLVARAWHWTWERNGAPQLNQRFSKLAGRDMTAEDWAAWVAVQTVIEALARAKAATPQAVGHMLRSADLSVDQYKGVRGNFRAWDGQLRQPILLTTHNATIASAPLDGFDHQADRLDTLGADRPESACLQLK
ncbi:ABC transporter substrate-binding protein [Primorskyibacter sp. 2E233]|uniref:ABC transporter substrate-binding protein n=1 Tax=Primorskyibacter sp. 2E233 TaxID=3413431 RepID=UPI003BF0A522